MCTTIRYAVTVFNAGSDGAHLTAKQILAAAREALETTSFNLSLGIATDFNDGQTTQRVSFELSGTNRHVRFVLFDENGTLVLDNESAYGLVRLVMVHCRQDCRAPDWCTHPQDPSITDKIVQLAARLHELLLR